MKKRLLFIAVALLLSNCESIFVEDISDNSIVLLAPLTNSKVANGSVTFTWQGIRDATQYEIQIATPSFANASQIVLDSTTTKTLISKDLKVNNYEWRVRAFNTAYNTVYVTNAFTVIATDFESKIISLMLPVDKDATNVKKQHLKWQALDGVNEYRVQVWQPDTNGAKLKDQAVSSTSYEYEFPEGDFTWQVRGETSSKNTVFSARTITVDTTAPNTPTLELPVDNAAIAVNTSIDFKWNRTSLAGTPELDSIYFYSEIGLKNLVQKNLGASKEYSKGDFSVGDYYWFVKSFDTAGNESISSATRKLIIN